MDAEHVCVWMEGGDKMASTRMNTTAGRVQRGWQTTEVDEGEGDMLDSGGVRCAGRKLVPIVVKLIVQMQSPVRAELSANRSLSLRRRLSAACETAAGDAFRTALSGRIF